MSAPELDINAFDVMWREALQEAEERQAAAERERAEQAELKRAAEATARKQLMLSSGFAELSEIWIVTLGYVEDEDFLAFATYEDAADYVRLHGSGILEAPVKLYSRKDES